MFRTTLRSIAGHKARLAMTALAVVLGVALMSGTLVLTDTVGKTFDDLVAGIYEDTDAVVRSSEVVEGQFGGDIRAPISADVLTDVESVPEVAVAEGAVQTLAQIVTPDGESLGGGNGPPTLGLSWGEVDELNPFDVVEGSAPTADDEVVIDRGSADQGDIAVGDVITVESILEPRQFTVSGIVMFGTADSPGGASIVGMTLPVAQDLAGIGDQFSEIGVVATEGTSQEEVVAAIDQALPDGTEAITGAEKTAEDQQSFQENLAFFNTFLLVFALVALLVGSFIIANTFSIIVAQRGKELALLRAIGASRRQVLGSVMGEAVIVGLGASAVGAALGIGVAAFLKALLAGFGIDIPSTSTVVEPGSVGTALVVGTAITVVAAALPAWRAGKVPPIAALRDVATDTSATSLLRIVLGLVAAALGAVQLVAGLSGASDNAAASIGGGLFFVFVAMVVLGPVIARPTAKVLGWPLQALGVTGHLARENAARSPKRTASTAAALMIGVGLVGFITIFAASSKASVNKIIDDAVSGDFVLAQEGFGFGFSPELTAAANEVDGVAVATPIRFEQAEVDGSGTFLSGVDTVLLPDIADPGLTQGDFTSMGVGDVAISDQVAEQDDLTLGDEITIKGSNGQEQSFTVAATYENRALAGDYVVTLDGFEQVSAAPRDFQTFITVEDGADLDAVRAGLDDATAEYASVEVQDLTEYKKSQVAPFNQILNLIYALLGLAVIIALIGIANTLALSVHERTRELGLLRAVGMKRDQLAASVVQESVIIAVLGTLLGLAIGLLGGWTMVQALSNEGIEVFSVPPFDMTVIVVIGALAGILAALFPAWKASKLNILDAIASE